MKNLSLVTFLTAIFGSLMVMAQVMQDRSYYKGHHSGGMHSLYPGFGGMYGGHQLMSHNMYGLGGYGMGHHGYGMHGIGHHGYGMHGLGHHGYGHHSIGHYGMPPTFIPVMGEHKKSYGGHIPYSPLISLLGSHHGGLHGGMYGR